MCYNTDINANLTNSYKEIPDLTHLLCCWHHKQNVKMNYRKYFPQNDKGEAWQRFIDRWIYYLNAPTFGKYSECWLAMQNIY